MTARVLVVDDSAANRKLLEARLQDEYFEVVGAASGAEAITLAQRWSPDIILLDVLMPVMDGFEACRRLKAQPATAHIPVVMVTSLNDQNERVRGLDAGADDFLVKPVDQATLFARLRALLRVKQVLDAWRLRAETVRDLGFEPPSAPPEDFEGAKVLLLSDNADEAAALSAALAADGMALEQYRDEKLVWAKLQDPSAHYDLVLTSLPMPEGDPLRLASRLRAEVETRDLPLMLIADDEQRDLVLRAFELLDGAACVVHLLFCHVECRYFRHLIVHILDTVSALFVQDVTGTNRISAKHRAESVGPLLGVQTR